MDTTKTWGHYAPNQKAWPLRTLIRIGLARGALKKRLVHSWIKRFGPILDIERSGIKYRLGLDDNVTDRRILTSSKRYDRPEIKSLIAACKKDVFIDLGANIGFYSLSLASAGSNVLAIEPNPAALERLRYNTQLNSFADKIKVVPFGVGESGEFQLSDKGDLGSASIQSSNATKSVTITTKPLLELLSENNIKAIGGLKIDIEGMEDRALRPFFESAPLSLWPKCIVIEHCCSDNWQEDIIAYMLNNGYRLQLKTRGNSVLKLKA
jgi:FkbM family methyltransferase